VTEGEPPEPSTPSQGEQQGTPDEDRWTEGVRSLDLTGDGRLEDDKAAVGAQTVEERREDTRKLITLCLLGGLGLVSVAWIAIGIWGSDSAVTEAGNSLDKIFTGILGLTGTAVGFYFGAASGTSKR
jgi:hypothetical protein